MTARVRVTRKNLSATQAAGPPSVQIGQFSERPRHCCDVGHRWVGLSNIGEQTVRGDGSRLPGGLSLPSPWVAPGLSAPELEMLLVYYGRHGRRTAIARNSGELAGRQPRGFVPNPGFEAGIESREFPLKAGLTLIGHHQLLCGGYSKARGWAPRRNSTAVPSIAYTWRGWNRDPLVHKDLCATALLHTAEETWLPNSIRRSSESWT
jgi:hypothetical protein